MNVSYRTDVGSYNWARPSEKELLVALHTPYGNISATWPEREGPSTNECLPTEVLSLIEERIESYWISTSREKDREIIANIRSHGKEIDEAWLKAKIKSHKTKVKDYQKRLSILMED